MKYLVESNQVAGIHYGGDTVPDNYHIVDSDLELFPDQVYFDGTQILVKPQRPAENAYWDVGSNQWVAPEPPEPPEPEVPLSQPRWDEFLAAFSMPGSPLYGSVVAKVAVSGFQVQDHWSNFKLLLSSPVLRSPESLAASIGYLATLLDGAGHTLTEEDMANWNDLMATYDFPEICHF